MKQRSFYAKMWGIWALLLIIGGVFLAIAVGMQFVPMSAENFNLRINGVYQQPTPENMQYARQLFLVIFGAVGGLLVIIGAVAFWRASWRRREGRWLKENGMRIVAQFHSFVPSNIRVNGRILPRLLCVYSDGQGEERYYESDLLRDDPQPYLSSDRVFVYYDQNRPDYYFVDVDGSAEQMF